MTDISTDTEARTILAAITATRNERGVCTVDDIAEQTGLTRSTAGRRLRALVDAGQVESLGRGGFRTVGERIQ